VSTTSRRATRRISASPARGSGQWWIVSTAIAASQAPSASGIRSAAACTAGALPAGRWRIIAADGSIASTVCGGSYDPAPAPTFHDRPRVADRLPDRSLDARVGAARGRVGAPDAVVHGARLRGAAVGFAVGHQGPQCRVRGRS